MAKKTMLLLAGAVWMLGAVSLHAEVSVDIYSEHTLIEGGTPYAGLAGSFLASDIMFGTNTGFDWHPFGLPDFGADITGTLVVAADGDYTFTLDSDDGSLLFIDGDLVIDNGELHPPQVVSDSIFLTAGEHPFEVQFFEDYNNTSGCDLYLPEGVTYGVIPAPGAALLAFLGTATVGWLRRRRALA